MTEKSFGIKKKVAYMVNLEFKTQEEYFKFVMQLLAGLDDKFSGDVAHQFFEEAYEEILKNDSMLDAYDLIRTGRKK